MKTHNSSSVRLWSVQYRILLAVCALLLAGNGAKAQSWNYAYTFGSVFNAENASTCFLDTAGNGYFFLKYANTVDFDPSVGVSNLTSPINTLSSTGVPTPALVKFSKTGTLGYAVNTVNDSGGLFATSGINYDKCVNDGTYVYAAGYFQNLITPNGTRIMGNNADFYVFKANMATGAIVWIKTFGNAAPLDYPGSITRDTSGNLYVAGFYNSITAGGTTYTVPAGGTDVDLFVMKMSAATGAVSWVTTGGTTAVDGDLNSTCSIVYSSKADKLTLLTTVGVLSSVSGRSFTMGGQSATTDASVDIAMADINMSTGAFTNMQYIGTSAIESVMSAGYDQPTGDIIVGGSYGAALTLSSGVTIPAPSATLNAWVARYNPVTRKFIWAKNLPHDGFVGSATQRNAFRSIASNNCGAVFCVANFNGSMTVDGNSYTSNGASDYFIGRLNVADGAYEWMTAGGSSVTTFNEYMIGTAADSQGRFLLTGSMSGSFTLDGQALTLPSGATDVFAMGATMPTVKTIKSSAVTATGASFSGAAVVAGGATITATGFVYGTVPAPKIGTATVVPVGTGIGSIAQSVTGLTPATTYYVRAYMSTNKGTFYGQQDTFVTSATVSNTTPTFTSGATTTLSACSGTSSDITASLKVSDADAAQTLTWTVTSAPAHGSLSGFPATAASGSTSVTPAGLSYTPTAGYSGADAFTVQVSDGTASSSITVNATVNPSPNPGVITPFATHWCMTAFSSHSTSGTTGGVWSSSNPSVASVNASSGTSKGISPGTTTISYTVSNGCGTASATVTDTILTLSDTGIVSPLSLTSICAGSTQTYSSTSTTSGQRYFNYSWTSSNTAVATINASTGVAFGKAAGTTTITYAAGGCGTFRASRMLTVLDTPGIVITTNPSIAAGTSPANLAFTTTGSPSTYTIDYNAAANTAGFNDVATATTLPVSPLALTVPGAAGVGTYNGTIQVANASCSSSPKPFSVTLTSANITPSYTLSSPQSITLCHDAAAVDIKPYLHVSDADAAQTLTWSVNAAPGHGTLTISGATATSGGADITPGGTLTYQPTAGYAGSDGFSITVSDGVTSSSMSVNVTVNSGPSIFGNLPVNVCSGNAFTITPSAGETSTYTWGVRSNTGSVTGASSGSGTSFSHTLVNPSNTTDGVVVYSVVPTSVATGCVGNSSDYTVNVRALPSVTTSTSKSICSGTNTSINLTASNASFFAWTIGANSGGITGASDGSSPSISQVLTNPVNTAAGYVEYLVTPTSMSLPGCPGATTTLTVKVNPIPVITSSTTYAICSGNTTSISLAASTPSGFSWNPTGSATGASAGTGATIAQALSTSSSFSDASTTYAITLTSDTGSCINNIGQNVSVTVYARPTSTTIAPFAMCSGASTSITLSASRPSTFSWTVSGNPSSVTGTADGSGSSIAQTLVNPGHAAAATVTYSVIPTTTTGSCVGTPFTVNQVINPSPQLTTSSSVSICSGNLLNVTLSATTPSFYSYTPGSITGGITGATSASGTGTFTQTLTNPGNVASGIVVYTITPTAVTGTCVGESGTLTVRVHPKPVGSFTELRRQCSGTPTNIVLVSSTPASKVWTVSSNPSGVTAAVDGSGDTIKQTLVNPVPYYDVYVQYSVTITSDSGGCVQNLIYLADTIKPAVPITVTSSPSVTAGTTSGNVEYSVPVPALDPLTYDIMYSAAAQTAGFTNVSDVVLPHSTFPASPVEVVIPATAPAAVYDATIRVKNASGCYTIPPTAFTVTILNRVPTFTTTTPQALTVCKDAGASSVVPFLHVSDEDGGQTLTWTTQTAPAHGTLTVTGATAASGTTDITPGGTVTYQPTAGYGGADSFSVKVSDGSDFSIRKFNVWVSDVSATVSQENVSCNGLSDGSAILSGINGTAPYNYVWAGTSGATATVTALAAGSYTATITDANTCVGTKVVTITEPATLTAAINTHTNVSCNGGNNGSAVVTTAGGTTPYTYSWSPSGGATATGTSLSMGDYTVTVTDAHSCTATAAVSITEPALVLASVSGTDTICNNTAAEVYFTSQPGTDVAYTINGGSVQHLTIGATGIDTVATGNLTAAAAYSLVNVTAGGCTYPSSGSATVSVFPQATVNTVSNQTVCNTANTTRVIFGGPVAGSTFTWTNNNTTIGLGASGADSIGSFTAVNTGTTAQTATVTVTPTANGCVGTPRAFTIKVNPTPAITAIPSNQAVCNNSSTTTLSYTANVSGTTYTWANNNSSVGLATTGTGSIVPFTATNSTTNPVTATVTVTPRANSCVGASQSFDITVNPTPQLSSGLSVAAVCDSATVAYTPASATAGTAYAWSRAAIAGISNSAATGADAVNEVLYNTTANPVTVTYVYTLTANSCPGTQSVTVVVNPTPVLTSTLTPAAICNNATFSYMPTSATTDAAFSWSRAAVTGISTAAATGNDNPNEVLTNTTTDPIAVTYVYTLTANSCSHVQNVVVTVNPTPVLTTTLTPTAICDNGTFNYVPASATAGTAFSWSRASVTGISNAANTGANDPAEVLHNTTADPVAVTYVYTLTANGCSNTQDVTVTVNPTPVLSSTLTATPVCNNTLFSYVPASATTGTTFSWSRATVAGISNAANTGADDPSETLVNTTADPVTVTYVYTLSANSCSNVQNVSVVVYPTPVLTSTLTPAAICDGATLSYAPTSATTGTAFSWSRDAVAGISNAANTGAGSPNEVLTNTTADPVTVTYVYTLTANGCSNTQNVTVVVNPTPVLSSAKELTPICDSTIFNYTPTSATAGTTFAWDRVGDEPFMNLPANGTDNPAEVLYLSMPFNSYANYVYTLSANGCIDTEHVSILVEPVPSLNSSLTPPAVCNNAAFNYTATSATPSVSFQWSRAAVTGVSNTAAAGSGNISESLTNTTTDPVEVTYVYTLTAGGCARTQAVKVTVNPTPVLTTTLTPTAICDNGTFNYVPASATAGTAFSWSRASVTGISNAANTGTNDPAEVLHNTTVDPVAATYVYTLTANGCSNTQDVTVTVNPTPVLSSTLTATPVCNNTLFSYVPASATTGTTFSWSRATVAGISNAASTGADDPSETLVNTTADPVTVTYVYTLSANSCSNVQNVSVVVYPTPVLTSTLTPTAICDGATFSYAPTSATAGTTFSWSRATVAGISNATATGADDPEESLLNTTADPVTVTYVYTLTANGCSNTQNVEIVVNPTPVFTSTLTPAAICNSTLFSYTPTSATAGTAFSWSRAAVTGITAPAATGTDDPAEILSNTTVDPVMVTYVYTLTANGCSNTQNVTVVVNPTPVFTSTLTPAAVCDSSLFSYTPASATVGTTYTWTRPVVPGIANAEATGADDPNEYLVNTLPIPVNVQYVYTLTANGCSNVQGVTVTVYPKPLLSTTLTPAAICDSTVFAYTPASLTTGTNYVWSRDVVAGISNPANADNTDPAEYLDNITADPVAVTYVYTLTANGCTNTQNVTVVVNPTPVFSSALTTTPVCDSSLFSYTPASPTAGTTFSWTRDALTGISNPAASGTGDPMEYLVNTTPFPVSLQYVYTLTANGCSHVQSVDMTVNPKPLLSSTLTPAAVCDSALFSYVPESLTGGTTYQWSRPLTVGIANTAATGVDNPAENLYNTTADPVTVAYTYTLTAYGCSNSQLVSVVVNPTPKLSTTLSPAAICNSTVFNYPAASATTGTAFAWSRALTSGISNAAASGTGNPMETLLNTTPAPVPVTYVYTLSANGCSFQQYVVATVNPTPTLSGVTTASVCSRAPFNYNPASATAGTAFTWTRSAAAGISNTAGSGTGAVNETLVNTTLAPKSVTYQYILTANGCSNPQTVLVTVQPTPAVPVIAITSPSSVCSNTQYQNFGAATDAPDTVQYKWTATGASVYAEGAGRRYALVNFPTAGNANVILTANASGFSCYARDTFAVSVGAATLPVSEIYYVNSHFIYTDNSVDSYQWGSDDATSLDSTIFTGQVDQNMYLPTPDFASSKYWVMITKGGCENKVYYNAPVGVTQVNGGEDISMDLFPNPATNNVYVQVNGGNGSGTVELVDLTGKVISKVALAGHKAVINVSTLASGVYMITSYNNGVKVATGKLVKE